MSVQDCMVCDQCGRHEERPSDWARMTGRMPLPEGWWTYAPPEGVAWMTFCGKRCVTQYLVKDVVVQP